MYLSFSILSGLFYFLLIGLFIKSARPQTVSTAIVSLYGKSLWLSWFIFLFVYITGYSSLSSLIVIAGCTVLAYQVIASKNQSFTQLIFPSKRHIIIFISVLTLIAIAGMADKAFNQYDLTFSTWDAVVSWNRWATELSAGVYKPYNAAYPILYPGIWSLIYQAQGDQINFLVTKGSTVILAIVIAVYSLTHLIEEFSLTSITILSVAIFVFFDQFSILTGGYMDASVAALMFLGFTLFIQALVNLDRSNTLNSSDIGLIYASAFLLATAAITKQPGFSACIIATIFIVILTFKKHLSITLTRNLLFILIVPSLSFFILFMLSGMELIGNIGVLENLAENRAGTENKYSYARQIITKEISGDFLSVMLVLSLLNLSFRKKYTALFGITCMLSCAAGFVVFANCCSYHYRNGLWLVALLCAAAVAGSYQLPDLISKNHYSSFALPNRFAKIAVVLMALIFFSSAFLLPGRDAIYEIQDRELRKIGQPQVNNILYENLDKLSETGIIITTYAYVRWLPAIKDRVKYCHPRLDYQACIKKTVKNRKDAMILKLRKEYRELHKHIHPAAFINNAGSWELFYIEDNKKLLEYLDTNKNQPYKTVAKPT